MTSGLDERTRLSIVLALTAGRGDPRQDAEARRLGLSGAEIDAARRGHSFDLRTSRAIALALGRTGHVGLRARAIQAGLDERSCREIERLAAAFTALDDGRPCDTGRPSW